MESRQTAHKVKVIDIISGKYEKGSDQTSNSLILNNKNVNRVNIMGTVVDNPSEYPTFSQLMIDDGSGKIVARKFDGKEILSSLNLGDPILIIGKPREYNNERYIVAEIIKKINNLKWLKVRDLELKKNKVENVSVVKDTKGSGEENFEDKTIQKIISVITELDSGSGVYFDTVIEKVNSPETDSKIKYLLEKGDLFEVSQGKLKLLE